MQVESERWLFESDIYNIFSDASIEVSAIATLVEGCSCRGLGGSSMFNVSIQILRRYGSRGGIGSSLARRAFHSCPSDHRLVEHRSGAAVHSFLSISGLAINHRCDMQSLCSGTARRCVI